MEDEDLRDFRRRVLGDKLLLPDEVEKWIVRTTQCDGIPATWWLPETPIPREWVVEQFRAIDENISQVRPANDEPPREPPPLAPLRLDLEISEEDVSFNFELKYLMHGLPGSEDEDALDVPIVAGGTLDELRRLSVRLAREYGWREGQATHYVLTGHPPIVFAMAAKFEPKVLTVLSRVVLFVDPALSPDEVAKQYRSIRRHVMSQRHRDLSAKHMALAEFYSAHQSDEPWSVVMAAWNESQVGEHPAWLYKNVSQFARDCRQAVARLLRDEERHDELDVGESWWIYP